MRKLTLMILLLCISFMSFGTCYDGTRYFGSQDSFPMPDAIRMAMADAKAKKRLAHFLSAVAHGDGSNITYRVLVAVSNDVSPRRLFYSVTKNRCICREDSETYTEGFPVLTFDALYEFFSTNGNDRAAINYIAWRAESKDWLVVRTNTYFVVRDNQDRSVLRRVEWR